MKSPDEIKKGLEYLSITNVAQKVEAAKKGLPYAYTEEVAADALALIQQLEFQNGELLKTVEMLKAEIEEYEEAADKCCYESRCNAELNQLEALCKQLRDEKEQLEAERDALSEELKNANSCFACKKFHRNGGECCGGSVCMMRDFEWRGPQKENH